MRTVDLLFRLAKELGDVHVKNLKSWVKEGSKIDSEAIESECEMIINGECFIVRVAKKY